MFNRWRAYPKRKPTTDGFYLCTIGLKGGEYVMRLWYNARFDTWSDKPRQKVFDRFAVFVSPKLTTEAGRMYTDELCDRTREVIGWKKLSKPMKMK